VRAEIRHFCCDDDFLESFFGIIFILTIFCDQVDSGDEEMDTICVGIQERVGCIEGGKE
jgi:hypothetical protein